MQIKWKFLCAALLLMSLWACNSNSANPETTEGEETTITETEKAAAPAPATVEAEASTPEGFWVQFKEAVGNKDIEKLKSMSDLSELGDDFFGDMFFMLFETKIAAAGPDAMKPAEGQAEGVYEFSYLEIPENPSSDEEGEGGGATLYFKKDAEGNFKLFNMMAYG